MLAPARRCDIDDHTKIQMAVVESRDQPLRRLADDRKNSDHAPETHIAFARCFQAERRYDHIAQGEQRLAPSRSRANIISAAVRAFNALPSTATRNASLNCAPASNAP